MKSSLSFSSSSTSSSAVPAFLVAGTSSGSGKTTVTLGLMAAFRDQGMRVRPFKCGPDFIDPGLHQLVTGQVSRNLDLWMCGESFSRQSFLQNSITGEIAIVEGVMGMFDGGHSCSADLASFLEIPLILVLDVRSMAESAAAIVRGFETLSPRNPVRGVILNRIASERHLQLVSDAISKHCTAEILGHLPRNLAFSIPSRHLGLLTGDEAPIGENALQTLSREISEHIDLDRLLELATPSSQISTTTPGDPAPKKCRIAVARDRAFCFYYEDNFDILRSAGAELIFFSPLVDQKLPEGIDGVYLGGGYPELYAAQLSKNTAMLQEIRNWVEANRVVYAECGGFMYLTEGIFDQDTQFHPMVGAFPTRATMQTKRASLGYRELTTKAVSCFGPAGTILRGHEFHYSSIEEMGDDIQRIFQLPGGGLEGYSVHRTLGGYMHLHFGFQPLAAENFINNCLDT